jgi:parallel beta-helix repeat protein
LKKIVLLIFALILFSKAVVVRSISPVVSYSTETKLPMEVDLPVHNIDSGKNFSTIQGAINDAETLDGHTILVDAGTYYEHVTINKSISLVGENRSTSIIDGNGAGEVVCVNGANHVSIVNFTIQNGDEGVMFENGNNNTLRNSVITSQGNGVHFVFSDNNTLSGNLISNNELGIGFEGEHNVLRHNNFVDNRYSFEVSGNYIQDIDNSNTVNGKTVYYWVNQTNKHVPPDAGYVALVNCRNMTVENLNLTENGQGLLLAHTTYSTVKNVTVSRNKIGIHFVDSHYNTITNSMILNNTCAGLGMSIEQMADWRAGILFYYSHSNIINNSLITFNKGCGIKQSYSNDNSIINSTISKNEGWGMNLGHVENVILNSNLVSENRDGILLGHSSNGTITDNIVTLNQDRGICLYNSRSATLTRNNMTKNRYNFEVDVGAYPVDPIHNVDTSNIVNGKPVYYWVNQHDRQVPADAGYVAIIKSENITVSNLSLSENWQGIFLAKTNNSIIEGVNVTNNQIGIYLWDCFGNKISECIASNNYHGIVATYSQGNEFRSNTVTLNSYYGLYLFRSTNNRISYNTISQNRWGIGLYYSSNNTFYHNNLIDNEEQVEHLGSPPPLNTWDNGSEGNYWSDYTGVDNDGDEIGDTPYVIDPGNQDNYPIVPEFPTWTPMLIILSVVTVAMAIYKRRLLKTPVH